MTMNQDTDAPTHFPASDEPGRTMADRVNAFDWSAHPLGPIPGWPRALKTVITTMMASRFPMYLAWGTEGFSFYNDGYIPILGVKHPQALGSPLNIVWGELEHDVRCLIEKTKEDKSCYFEDLPLSLMRRGVLEQCYFTFSYSAVRGDTGQVEGFFSVCIETTHAYHAKQQHMRQNEDLLALFKQAPGFMAALKGPDHVFEIANEAYRDLIGPERAILGKSILEALPEVKDQGFIELLDEVYRSGTPYAGRAVRLNIARTENGPMAEIFVDFIYQPIFDSAKCVNGILVQGHEVTEAHLARQALIAAAMHKDHFIATLAHELRNPLAPIRAASKILQAPAVPASMLAKTSAVISRQVEQMSKLLDDLLDVARIAKCQVQLDKQHLAVTEVVAAAIETAQPLVDRKGQTIATSQDSSILIDADRVRITQALANIVCNAAKYTNPGGHIEIRTERSDSRCRISVRDNGVGISNESITSIFEMFAQENDVLDRAEGGLGIGLALAKGFVELHDGKIHAHSEGKGMGSIFTVEIPCIPVESAKQTVSIPMDTRSVPRPLKILIADDNADMVDMLATFLKLEGSTVVSAANGLKALDIVRSENPDVAILDVGMPGMNGYELARTIRNERSRGEVTLIASTGWGSKEDMQKTKDAGFDFHLTKPFGLEALTDLLSQIDRH